MVASAKERGTYDDELESKIETNRKALRETTFM